MHCSLRFGCFAFVGVIVNWDEIRERIDEWLEAREDRATRLRSRVQQCYFVEDDDLWLAETTDGHRFRKAKGNTWFSADEGWIVLLDSPLGEALEDARRAAGWGGGMWVRRTNRCRP